MEGHPSPSNYRFTGFTLVELLVVIAIIGILIALLLPAVQSAREAARSSHCKNNLKQLALALHNYHDAHKTFPPSVQFDWGSNAANSDVHRPNWLIMILPFIELQNLHEQFDFKQPISQGTRNRQTRGTYVPGFACPSDIGQEVTFRGTIGGNDGDNWARGSYAANGAASQLGWGGWSFVCHCGYGGEGPQQAPSWADPRFRGVMGACVAVPIKKITDGTSHTMLLAEIRIGVNEYDHRGTWAMGTAGASALFGHSSLGDANGPNQCATASDDTRNCSYLHNTDPGVGRLNDDCMACYEATANDQAAARSRHTGGLYSALCDGSVTFISELMDTGGAYGNYGQFGSAFNPSAWDRLISCCDGGQVSPGDYE